VLCKQKQVNAAIDGESVALFWAVLAFGNVSATGRGHIDFQESDDTQVGEIDIAGILQGVAVVDYDITGGAKKVLLDQRKPYKPLSIVEVAGIKARELIMLPAPPLPLPLDEAVAAIGALDLDADLPPAHWPFIEVSVAVTGPEPLLHQKVLAALADRPLRLVRLRRHFVAQGDQLETGAEPVDLDDLDPAAVFARLYADQHEGEAPPEDLAQAFARLMIDTQTTQEPR
jgi:hypothetical protein